MEKRRGGNDGQKYFLKTEGGVLDSCTVPASIWLVHVSSVRTASTQTCICENNWIRSIAGVWRVKRRRMKDLRESESESESEIFIRSFQTQETSAKTITGRCRRGHLEK